MILRSLFLAVSLFAICANAASNDVAIKPAAGATGSTLVCRSSNRRLPSGLNVFRDCSVAPEMIALRGGRFRMGDLVGDGQPYERPIHEVQIAPVAVGRYEVTYAEWQTCVKDGACVESHKPVDDQHGRYPVAGVNWKEAKTYVDWLAARTGKPYRLLSEAEWEYAARSSNQGRYYWGSFDPNICSYANLMDVSGRREHPDAYWAEKCDDHFPAAAPVGSFPPNAWGFYDMLGNVWEWVADCWHSDYSGAPNDGSAWLGDNCRKHVNRGGGWGNNVNALRLSSRDADPTDTVSDGLGFRVARSLSASEIQQGLHAAPDIQPTPEEPEIVNKWTRRASKTATASESAPVLIAAPLPAPVTSLAVERQLDVHITVEGTQSWKNVLQHTQGNTKQDYVLSTHLRSDGILYGDNLLDLDMNKRLSIKQQYLARRGLIRLKAFNGGRLPRSAEELAALKAKVQTASTNCIAIDQCLGESVERLAALTALENNSADDLDALIAAPATGEAARWLYFFGYAGCPNRIHISNETHIAGERAYNHAKTSLVPWSLDRTAVSDGSAADRSALCMRYTVTVDIRSGDVYVENLFIPSPRGTTVLQRHNTHEESQDDLPVPTEVLNWSSARLRKTSESVNLSDTLKTTWPLDGDSTVLGSFDGKLDVTMSWSFKPVTGAAMAVIPMADAMTR